MRPSHLSIDSVLYELDEGEDAFEVIYEQVVVQQPDLSGESRPSKNARPDDLTYTKSDWSQGEGYEVRDISAEHPSLRGYWYNSDGAVDIRIPGKVSLGLAVTDAVAGINAGHNYGPYLVVANRYLAAICGGASPTQASRRYDGTTWSDLTTGATTEGINGATGMGNNAYACAGTTIRRINVSANTNATYTTVSAAYAPKAFDNRFHVLVQDSVNSRQSLQRNNLTDAVPVTLTPVYTIAEHLYGLGIAFVGPRAWMLAQANDGRASLHEWDGSVGREIPTLPEGFRVYTNLAGAYGGDGAAPLGGLLNLITSLDNVIYFGGWRDGGSGEPERPVVMYFDGVQPGTLAVIRDRVDTSRKRVDSLTTGREHEVLIGVVDATATTEAAQGFMYHNQLNALSELFSGFPTPTTDGSEIVSIAYWQGRYYFGLYHDQDPKVYATLLSGTGKHPSQTTIIEPISDFGYPGIEKVLATLTIETETLAAGTSVEFSILLDDTTTITTDASGATLAHTSGTRTTFTLSDHDTERICRWVQPKVILKTSNTANTPILKKWVLTARGASKQKFYQFRINGRGRNLTPNQAITGAKAMQTLRTLTENTANRVVALIPYFLSAPPPQERGSAGGSTAESVIIEAARFSEDHQGEGTATLRCAVLPGRV